MSAAIFVAIFLALFVAISLTLLGKQWSVEEEKARARRMAEHKMNARLLRFNI